MRDIGTAGHVDHGKSTLIAALTGTHPDRLKEEQEREMTIDLGFGWLNLPGGEEIGIVDVPANLYRRVSVQVNQRIRTNQHQYCTDPALHILDITPRTLAANELFFTDPLRH